MPMPRSAGLGHRDHERIALLRTHHGKADSGIAAGGLNNGLPGLELARPLSLFDHAQRQAVLDRAERVEGLDLHKQVDALGRQLSNSDNGGVTHGLQDVLIFGPHRISSSKVRSLPSQSIPGIIWRDSAPTSPGMK
jgi:hypothetical protein